MDGIPPKEVSVSNHDPALPAVPLLDMQRQYEPLRDAIRAAIDRVCESGRFVLGPDCEQLEKGIAAFVGTKHAVACASGSDALLLALMALDVQTGRRSDRPQLHVLRHGQRRLAVGRRRRSLSISSRARST